ncbi:hypothetical protein F4813DRAFT_383192 [Daldinia decipiens]|uniref:uncharacterized protein n=1 Tax=Daldinia decipiens TaxID=326647 RepID=UPI0020C26B28|nr:uncharacterized protein F4813DRAFT_383192 [Daldinia decipiens]KAI1653534.1 hypothetical protein F4813DRAFT_383192 [Daldinia decipiens]
MTSPDVIPAKSRRVRTGCLTCRERHLKCDEGTPDCLNCRKSNRECKRGVRLNFIDMTCKEPPYIPTTEEWAVHFQDESRLIASEYKGGLGRYANLDSRPLSPPRESNFKTTSQLQPSVVESLDPQVKVESRSTTVVSPPHNYYGDRSQTHLDLITGNHLHSRKSSEASFMAPLGHGRSAGYSNMMSDPFGSTKIESNRSASHNEYRSDDVSTAASVAGFTGAGPPSTFRGGSGDSNVEPDADVGIMTPSSEKSGEREYLNSPEELRFMQVFVSEVGIWMDSLDKEKHFSRQIPYHALKCPMLLNALLACGVKHLTLTQQYGDDKALFYYDTATTQLLRSLQNPERDTAECATTAVVLNVYEIMSDKPTKRMSHIAGARALIRECGWNAKSKGLGAACFWLNVGMELLSCLAFNWQTAWEPEKWGLDMDFNTEKDTGNEEVWVHRIFYIVAKIANFRASIPKFQEPSPHDEQVRLQARYAEWQRLKNMCDDWNNSCPRPMHPFGYLYPSQQTGANNSLFPNVWLIKRAAIVGRLYYHTAQCLLAQINPILPKNSEEARRVQQHHAHQVCGIVAHTKDRGVASVSIRSLAIVAEILTDLAEQQEVVAILEKIDHETGWKLSGVIQGLRKSWGWEKMGQKGLVAQFLPRTGSGNKAAMGLEEHYRQMESIHASLTTTTPSQHQMIHTVPQSGSQQLAAPRPMHVNPLSFADFSLPNHPYQNWYEPPSRSHAYSSQSLL